MNMDKTKTFFNITNFSMCSLVLLAFLCYMISTVDYDTLLLFLTRYLENKNIPRYLTYEVYGRAVIKLKVFTALLLVASAIVYVLRKKSGQTLEKIKRDFSVFWGDLKKYCINVVFDMDKYERICFLTLFGVAFFLRMLYLNQPIRGDEAVVFEYLAKQPLPVIMTSYHNVGNHIFHTILMHLTWLLGGEAVWVIRLPVFLSGILLIPLVYFFVRSIYGVSVALCSTALVASSSVLIEYSTNSRGYELQALIIICLFGLGIYHLKKTNYFSWTLWVLLVALGFWTLPTTFYSYGAIAIWFIISLFLDESSKNVDRKKILRFFVLANVLAALLTGLFYSPVLIVCGLGGMPDMLNNSVNFWETLRKLISKLQVENLRNVSTLLQPAFLFLGVLGILFQSKFSKNKINLLLCSVLWVGLSTLILPPYIIYTQYTRLWLTHNIFLYITIGIGISAMIQLCLARIVTRVDKISPSLIAKWVSLFLVFVLGFQEWRHNTVHEILDDSFHDAALVAKYLSHEMQPGDYIYAVCPYHSPLRYEVGRLNNKLEDIDIKDRTGQVVTFSFLKHLDTKPNKNLNLVRRLFLISVPAYSGFGSAGEFNEVIASKNLDHWKRKGLKTEVNFSKTKIYSIELPMLTRLGYNLSPLEEL